eukprot:4680307-Pyramimonas_sp.AAC.1
MYRFRSPGRVASARAAASGAETIGDASLVIAHPPARRQQRVPLQHAQMRRLTLLAAGLV